MRLKITSSHEKFTLKEQLLLGRTLALLSTPEHQFVIQQEYEDTLHIRIEGAQVMPVLKFLATIAREYPKRTYWITFADETQHYEVKLENGFCSISM